VDDYYSIYGSGSRRGSKNFEEEPPEQIEHHALVFKQLQQLKLRKGPRLLQGSVSSRYVHLSSRCFSAWSSLARSSALGASSAEEAEVC